MNTDIMPTANTDEKLKSYWSRPGGKLGSVIGLGLLTIVGYYVLPILTTIIWNTLNFGIACVAIGVFLYVITNRKFRLSFFYFYEILMKKLIGVVIELDPFIIAEDYIKEMQKQREILSEQTVEVAAQKEKIVGKINDKLSEKNKLLLKAKTAQQNGLAEEMGVITRQVVRLDDYVKQLTPIRDNLGRVEDYLNKVYKNSAYLIEDSKNELEYRKDLYYSVTSGNKALNSALKIFEGDPEKKLLVEQSMEFLKDDIAGKLANMKKNISKSSDFMKSIDLDNATFEQQGLLMLDEYNPDDYKLSVALNNRAGRPLEVEPRVLGTVNKGQYSDLLS